MTASEPAALGARVLACVIDGAIGAGAAVFAAAGCAAVLAGTVHDPRGVFVVVATVQAVSWLVALAWLVVLSVLQGGAGSVGQRALGLRTVDRDTGAPLGFGRALVRNLVWALGGAIVVGYVSPLFDAGAYRQGWHDRAARAVMVRVARDGAGMPQPSPVHRSVPVSQPVAPGAPGVPAPEPAWVTTGAGAPAVPPPVREAGETVDGDSIPYLTAQGSATGAGSRAVGTRRTAPAPSSAPTPPAAPAWITPRPLPAAGAVAPDSSAAEPAPSAAASPGHTTPGAETLGAETPGATASAPATPAVTGAYLRPAAGRSDAPRPFSTVPAGWPSSPSPFAAPVQPAPAAGPAPMLAPPVPAAPALPVERRGVISQVPGVTHDRSTATDVPPESPPPTGAVASASPGPVDVGQTIGATTITRGFAAAALGPDGAAPASAAAMLVWDNGTRTGIHGRTVLGRNPAGEDGAVVVAVRDETLSLSKTHFEMGVDATGVWVVDRHSTNGVVLVRNGRRAPVVPGRRAPVRDGDRLEFGDRTATVEILG
ncbi:RDD family protein [Microbacterium luticocti]|uniref:RDD family protein n=1 Tax=Microbacterium luticocti TaxID=451764 RepID=UPI0003F4E57B|nr:RDD family protein [Microbacterium luticocti]